MLPVSHHNYSIRYWWYMKLTNRCAALLALTAIAGTVSAQDVIAVSNNPWEGFFVGANIGGAWNHTCQSWEPGPIITE